MTITKQNSLTIKAALVLFAIVSLLSLTGCSPEQPKQATDTLDSVKIRKEIRAAILIYPPTVDLDKSNGQASGFLVEIMNEVAKRAEWTIKYEPTTWEDLRAAISSSRYDIVVGAVFVSIPRAKEMAFTDPIIYWQGTGVVVPTSQVDKFKQPADMNMPGLRIVATAGTVEYDFAKRNFPLANVEPIPNDDMTLTMSEVMAGRATAAVANFDTIRKFIKTNKGLSIAFDGEPFSANAAGFVVKQGDTRWREFLNNALLTLQVDGTIRELSEKYGSQATWILPRNTWRQ